MTLIENSNTLVAPILSTLNIKYTISRTGCVLVDRDSMVNASPRQWDDVCYNTVRDLVSETLGPTYYVSWGARTDDYLGLDVYSR